MKSVARKLSSFPTYVSRRSIFGRLAVVCAVAAVVGCDDSGASDKKTVEAVDAAVAQIGSLPSLAPGEGVETVSRALTSAADAASAGPFKAVAAASAAAVDQQSAYAGALKLKTLESEVRRTLLDLRRLGDQVATNSVYAAGYLKGDPKSAVAELSTRISGIQGNAQNLSWGDPNPTPPAPAKVEIPTLAAAKQDASRLEGEIEQKQTQLTGMQKQRTDALSTAEVQLNHANSLKGEDGVRAFADASSSRRAADDLAINIDLVQVQLARLQSDLAVSNGVVAVLGAGVGGLTEQGKLLENDWVGVQKAAARQKQLATAAIEGDDKTKQSIKSTLATLTKQLADLATARSALLEQLNEAIKYAELSFSEANTFSTSLTTKLTQPGKEAAVYVALKNSVNPQRFQYSLGTVQRDRALMELAEMSLLTDVKSAVEGTRTAIESNGLTAPSELSAIDTAAAEQLGKAAEDDFVEAAKSLANVESGDGTKELKDAAKTARLITLFSHLHLYDLRELAGDTTARAAATTMLSDAQALKTELTGSNVPLPALPGELGDATPATQPATPATPPAG